MRIFLFLLTFPLLAQWAVEPVVRPGDIYVFSDVSGVNMYRVPPALVTWPTTRPLPQPYVMSGSGMYWPLQSCAICDCPTTLPDNPYPRLYFQNYGNSVNMHEAKKPREKFKSQITHPHADYSRRLREKHEKDNLAEFRKEILSAVDKASKHQSTIPWDIGGSEMKGDFVMQSTEPLGYVGLTVPGRAGTDGIRLPQQDQSFHPKQRLPSTTLELGIGEVIGGAEVLGYSRITVPRVKRLNPLESARYFIQDAVTGEYKLVEDVMKGRP